MRPTEHDKLALREIDAWQRSAGSPVHQAMNWLMTPVDWLMESIAPAAFTDRIADAVGEALGMLSDASSWTHAAETGLQRAKDAGLDVESIAALRDAPLDELDALAKDRFNEHTLLAALEGGGTGLGGAALIVADIPLLFAINFRLIQQIGACYGFEVKGSEFRPLTLAIFNVSASGSREAKAAAMREVSVAAASFAHDFDYKGRPGGEQTLRSQNRHVPREIAKNLVGRKMAQLIPIAGAAVGAGVNYWFTQQTAEAAYMLFRAIHVERRERL